MQRTFQHWIVMQWLKIDQDNLLIKFSALNVNFSSRSSDPLGSWRPGRRASNTATPLKSGYFTAIITCSMKTVPDKHRHAAYHNKQWWQTFCWCQCRWPWMTPKIGVLVHFCDFRLQHILRMNCAEIARDRPGHPAYDISSIERTFLWI